MDIKVLGTTFDVKAYPEEEAIFVALETGSIELKSRSFKSYQLRPGEKAVYNKASGRCEVLRSHDVKMYSAWRRNVLVFKSAPLSDVMKTLARTYDISFDVKDSAALRYTYTITTDSVNLTTVLKELEKSRLYYSRKRGQDRSTDEKIKKLAITTHPFRFVVCLFDRRAGNRVLTLK